MQRHYVRTGTQYKQRTQHRPNVQQRQQVQHEPQPQIQQYDVRQYEYTNDSRGDPNFTKNLVVFFLSIVFVLGAGYGAYYWQNSQSESSNDELYAVAEEPAEISSSGEVKSAFNSNKLVNYKGNVGSLELKLPEKYAVIVKVDGNFGDSERTILHISEKLGEGVYRDVLDDYIEVEVTKTNKSVKKELANYRSDMENNGYTLGEQFDAKVGKYTANLITGQSLFAQVRVYIIINEGYSYRFARILPLGEENKDNDNMIALLNGMSLDNGGL